MITLLLLQIRGTDIILVFGLLLQAIILGNVHYMPQVLYLLLHRLPGIPASLLLCSFSQLGLISSRDLTLRHVRFEVGYSLSENVAAINSIVGV